MSGKSMNQVTTVSIDIGKNTFHLVGLDGQGSIVLRQKLTRGQVRERLANLPRCVIGMEACIGAHHLNCQCRPWAMRLT
jgi:transposase